MENSKVKPILVNTNNESKIWVYVRRGSGKITFSGKSIIIDGKFSDTEISNGAICYDPPFDIMNSQILFRLSDYNEPKNIKKIERIFEELNINIGTKENVVERFLEILEDNGYDVESDFGMKRTWIIAPKFNKKLVGKKNIIEVDFRQPTFDRYYDYKELETLNTFRDIEVYSTPISKDGLSDVKYTMHIPDDLYYSLQKLPDEKLRPQNKVIEDVLISNVIKILNEHIGNVIGYFKLEKDEEKYEKMILIKYSSSNTKMRDDFNFAYIGENIGVGFRYYIGWVQKKESRGILTSKYDTFFTNLKYDNGNVYEKKCRINESSISNRGEIIVPWTKEREDFLNMLQNSFTNLKNNLDKFLSEMDESKLDLLIENKEQFLKLN